jgi:hypothetical protein
MSIRGRAIVKPSLSGLLDILNHLQAYHAHARRALVRITSGRSGPHRFAAIDSEFLMQRIAQLPTAADLWRATMLIAFVAAVLGIVGIEALWRYLAACSSI